MDPPHRLVHSFRLTSRDDPPSAVTYTLMIANLKKNTGKSLDQSIAIAKKSGAAKHGEIVKMLKADHGMTHGFANLVSLKTLKSDAGSIGETADLVAAQYAGDKAALKPIYDALIKAAMSCGGIEIAPKKAYVSHRVRLEKAADVDKDVKVWIKAAWSQA